jgi:CMP-N-acetylneuraminic acid synthetase
MKNKTFIAVITARKGSKGIKNKNLKLLCGVPLIGWPIAVAKRSGIFDRIVVYSDCPKIRKYAELCGVDTLIEPDELAADKSIVHDALVDCLEQVDKKWGRYDYVQLMQPTSPGVRPNQVKNAAKQILGLNPFERVGNCDFVIGVHQYKDPTIVVKDIPKDFSLRGWYPEEFKNKNRQDFPAAYRLNGYIYLGKWDIFAERKDWWQTDIRAFICLPEDDIDIDTHADWELAELRLKGRTR